MKIRLWKMCIAIFVCILLCACGNTEKDPGFTSPSEKGATGDIESDYREDDSLEETSTENDTTGRDIFSERPVSNTLELDKLYALYHPDQSIMTIDGRSISWDEYFYFLTTQISYVEDYFAQISDYYGIALSWSDTIKGENKTYAFMATDTVEQALCQFAAIERFAAENGVELTAGNRDAMDRQKEEDMTELCGGCATEETFKKALAEFYLTPALYERINTVNQLYQECYRQTYGGINEGMKETAADDPDYNEKLQTYMGVIQIEYAQEFKIPNLIDFEVETHTSSQNSSFDSSNSNPAKTATCNYCHGTGKVNGEKCSWCNGTGKTYDNAFNDMLG